MDDRCRACRVINRRGREQACLPPDKLEDWRKRGQACPRAELLPGNEVPFLLVQLAMSEEARSYGDRLFLELVPEQGRRVVAERVAVALLHPEVSKARRTAVDRELRRRQAARARRR